MKIKKFVNTLYFFFKQRSYRGRMKYVFQKNHSDTLIIVFSAFADKPGYNYFRTLSDVKADKLFILDNFGYKGSYYWFENGFDEPMQLTKSLIECFVKGGRYKSLITLGSSKGGTCAIYYGLLYNANHIFSGANQYYVGKYLNTEAHSPIFKAMMGNDAGERETTILDTIMPNVIREHAGSCSVVHLLYSKQEHTYDNDIKYMLDAFKENKITYTERVESFEDHNEVGKYFAKYIRGCLKEMDL